MRAALEQARTAVACGEVPVGAVAVFENRIVATAHNEMERQRSATAHAERLLIDRASEALLNWRLEGVSIYVTLEPCTMCVGAMLLARVNSIFFACDDPRQGAAGSLYDLTNLSPGDSIGVYSGVLAEEARELLQRFFAERRGV